MKNIVRQRRGGMASNPSAEQQRFWVPCLPLGASMRSDKVRNGVGYTLDPSPTRIYCSVRRI